MCKCKICGKETRKNRQICLGCTCTKAVFKKKNKASKTEVKKATEHMLSTDIDMSLISWKSFSK